MWRGLIRARCLPRGWTKRLRRAKDVRGEVGGGGWIAPGGGALRRERWAGLSGCSQPWAAWRVLSEGVRSRRRRMETKPGRDRCGFEAARRLRADMGGGGGAEGSCGIGVSGSPPGEPGAGKEGDFAGAFDAPDATHLGALAVGAGERGQGGGGGPLGGQ